MRLSPKSVFLGLVALGLPFAVTIGWLAAAPPAAHAPVPAGAGTLGSAPATVPPTSADPIETGWWSPVPAVSLPPTHPVHDSAAPQAASPSPTPVSPAPSASPPGEPSPSPPVASSAPPPSSAAPSPEATDPSPAAPE